MVWYTQLIYIKKNAEAIFNSFEANVLPLLKNHGGELVYRIRPDSNCVTASTRKLPYEIHLVTFNTRQGFESYVNDPERIAFMELKNTSVKKIILIEGIEL